MREGKKVQVVIMFQNLSQSLSPRVLLLQTNERRGGFWQNVTGSLEGEESFSQAAKRELGEETGFTKAQMFPLDLSLDFYHKGRKTFYTEQCFLAVLKAPSNPQIDPEEHQGFRWIPISQMTPAHYLYENNFKAFEKATDLLQTLPLDL
ncbi:MAG: NUDIX domain-containing protein [Bacteriovoracales bacterium]|nr:NUDIX domain-containing protein [Bacteriovoracales bacterium]